jgi:hypothetical protein
MNALGNNLFNELKNAGWNVDGTFAFIEKADYTMTAVWREYMDGTSADIHVSKSSNHAGQSEKHISTEGKTVKGLMKEIEKL